MKTYRKMRLVYIGKPEEIGEPVKTPLDAINRVKKAIGKETVEVFLALLLNGRHCVLGDTVISQGTLTHSLVHPREVFRMAIKRGAAAIILAHNHPSGNSTPSAEDQAVTERMINAGNILGINVLDHLIIGADGFTSMRDSIHNLFKE